MDYCVYEPPIAFVPLFVAVDGKGRLVRLEFIRGEGVAAHVRDGDQEAPAACAHVVDQLDSYFRRERKSFDLEVAPEGTAFQREVWSALRDIPYGETRSYGELAAQLKRSEAARAVGAANGANPVAIVIPCHRVIGADGKLTGFGGGLELKARLLDLERPNLFAQSF